MNASGQLDEEIDWFFQDPVKALRVVDNYERRFRSRLPEIGWVLFWLGVVLTGIGCLLLVRE